MSIVISRATEFFEGEVAGESDGFYSGYCLVCGTENFVKLTDAEVKGKPAKKITPIEPYVCEHFCTGSTFCNFIDPKLLQYGLFLHFGIVAGEGENFLENPISETEMWKL